MPYTVHRGRVKFLLGKEVFVPDYGDSDKWSDFGGKLKSGETIKAGAAREFYEETAGCVMDLAEARQRLEEGEYLFESDLHPPKSASFRTYLMYVPFADYPGMFRRTRRFLQHVGGNVSIIEKSQLRWFTREELADVVFLQWGADRYTRRPQLRAKFVEMLRRILSAVDLDRACVDAPRYD